MPGDSYAVFVEGLENLADIEGTKRDVERAAYRAINYAADRARTEAQRQIQAELNFPSGYMNPSTGRLAVTQKANSSNLEARVTGRMRPTSLARFLTSGRSTPRGQPLTVEVKKGKSSTLVKAFLMKLNVGASRTDTQFNLGLAVRLKPGASFRNKRVVPMGKGLYLIYGPSVSQAFKIVADVQSIQTLDALETEFWRQMGVQQ